MSTRADARNGQFIQIGVTLAVFDSDFACGPQLKHVIWVESMLLLYFLCCPAVITTEKKAKQKQRFSVVFGLVQIIQRSLRAG